MHRHTRWSLNALGAALLILPPIVGPLRRGERLADYLAFPPLTRPVAHPPFAWGVFILMATGILAVLLPIALRIVRAPAPPPVLAPRRWPRRWPWWGRLGLLFGLAAWVLAWTRFAWFARWQTFTFSPLWLAYIVVVNALTWRRSGHCLLTDQPRRLGLLALASAVFWWYFEYLNRFVANWYYERVGGLSAFEYVLFATLPFATVLPAVMSTEEWLATHPRLSAGLAGFRSRSRPGPVAGWGLLGLAAVGMAGIGVCPQYLFPLLWIAPLLVMSGLDLVTGRAHLFDAVWRGDWTRVVRVALAALICGFFWEMWNMWSLARWVYTVPYVNRFHLFEMPLLGFAGYLPFGLECALLADRFKKGGSL